MIDILERLGLTEPCGACNARGILFDENGWFAGDCPSCDRAGRVPSARGGRFLAWLSAEFERHETREVLYKPPGTSMAAVPVPGFGATFTVTASAREAKDSSDRGMPG